MRTQRLEMNEVYARYLEDDTRTQIFFGGSSSGKSFFLAQRAVLDVLRGRNYLVVRNVARTLQASVYNQVVKTIDGMGLRGQFSVLKSEMTVTCRYNRRQILFAGLDDIEKLKSITPADGVLTDIWIEEATEVRYDVYKQLTKRLRGGAGRAEGAGEGAAGRRGDGEVAKRVIFSFNPVTKEHWIYREFFGGWVEGVSENELRAEGLLICKTTYRDNAFLTGGDVGFLEDESDPYFYSVYTLGNWGVLGRVIYRNWRVEDLSGLRAGFDNIRSGLDFGFAEDPNALVRAHVDEKRRCIYVFEEMVAFGQHDDELAGELRRRLGDGYVACDSADPKAIDDLCRRGVRALGAVKGPDSVRFGIRYLQGFEIIIDPACRVFKGEIEKYQWAEDKYGNAMSRPVDRDNHLLDALRYAVEDLMLENRARAARRI